MTEIKATQNQEIKISKYKPVIYEIKYKGNNMEIQDMWNNKYRILYEGIIYIAIRRDNEWFIYNESTVDEPPPEVEETFLKFMEV